MKYKVLIEESVVDEFEVEASSDEEAMDIAIKNYKQGVFVLEPGEITHKQISFIDENDQSTEWIEF